MPPRVTTCRGLSCRVAAALVTIWRRSSCDHLVRSVVGDITRATDGDQGSAREGPSSGDDLDSCPQCGARVRVPGGTNAVRPDPISPIRWGHWFDPSCAHSIDPPLLKTAGFRSDKGPAIEPQRDVRTAPSVRRCGLRARHPSSRRRCRCVPRKGDARIAMHSHLAGRNDSPVAEPNRRPPWRRRRDAPPTRASGS